MLLLLTARQIRLGLDSAFATQYIAMSDRTTQTLHDEHEILHDDTPVTSVYEYPKLHCTLLLTLRSKILFRRIM